jgi:hypothetical protein
MAEIDDYFADKPETHKIYRVVEQRILALGPAERAVESQISFGVNRKFAWFWLYNVTQKNPNGILHLMLALDHDTDDPHVRDISKVGKAIPARSGPPCWGLPPRARPVRRRSGRRR